MQKWLFVKSAGRGDIGLFRILQEEKGLKLTRSDSENIEPPGDISIMDKIETALRQGRSLDDIQALAQAEGFLVEIKD